MWPTYVLWGMITEQRNLEARDPGWAVNRESTNRQPVPTANRKDHTAPALHSSPTPRGAPVHHLRGVCSQRERGEQLQAEHISSPRHLGAEGRLKHHRRLAEALDVLPPLLPDHVPRLQAAQQLPDCPAKGGRSRTQEIRPRALNTAARTGADRSFRHIARPLPPHPLQLVPSPVTPKACWPAPAPGRGRADAGSTMEKPEYFSMLAAQY